MRYIHLRGFMHRDLKPSNILLNNEYEVRISDFGLTRDDKLDTYQSKGVGTLRFIAPELLAEDDDDDEDEGEKKAKYTNKIDVYSFGITLIFIITGKCSSSSSSSSSARSSGASTTSSSIVIYII